MKTPLKILISIAITSFFIWACSSNDDDAQMLDDDMAQTDDVNPGDTNPDGQGQTGPSEIDLQVILPEGSAIELATTTVIAQGGDFNTSGNDGTFRIPIELGTENFVYLLDGEQNLLLFGFVTPERKTLSVTSTVEAAMFYHLGTVFQPKEIRDLFFENIGNFNEIVELIGQLNSLFIENSNWLESNEFINQLKETAEALVNDKTVIDIPTTGILIPDNSIRSGTKVIQDDGPLALSIQNIYRRRAHAFVYKKAVKKIGESNFDNLFEGRVGDDPQRMAEIEIPISATTGVTSIIGNTVDIYQGNGLNLGATLNKSPKDLEISEGDSQSKYLVRVIGPGTKAWEVPDALTETEGEKLKKLGIETYFFDFILPVATTLFGFADATPPEIDASTFELINTVVASSPNALDAWDEGNFVEGLQLFVQDLALNSATTERFIEAMAKLTNSNALDKLSPSEFAEKAAKPLAITNAILQSSDILRIIDHLSDSSGLEEIEVIATKSVVRINPYVRSVLAGNEVGFKAEVLDSENEDDYNFIWSTTGDYGELDSDNLNQQPNLRFDNEVVYISDEDAFVLAESKIDSVFVQVFDDEDLIGESSAAVRVFQEKYRISPSNPTIKGNTRLTLNVIDENGKLFGNEELVESGDIEFKIEWNIPSGGSYGLLNGVSSSLTGEINQNRMVYFAMDEEVERGIEYITAKLYKRAVSGTGIFRLVGEVDANIIIENDDDENTFQFEVPAIGGPVVAYPEASGTRTLFHGGFRPIPYFEKAVRYEIEVIQYGINGTVIENVTGLRRSWTNESWSINQGIGTMSFIQSAGNPNLEVVDDPTTGFAIGLTGASVNTDFPQYADIESDFASIFGTAKVTITLEN